MAGSCTFGVIRRSTGSLGTIRYHALLSQTRSISTKVEEGDENFSGIRSLGFPTYMVWGADTDVGKTLVSAGLAYACQSHQGSFFYLKPVQTGYPQDSDSALVESAFELAARTQFSQGDDGRRPTSAFKTLFGYRQPVSPHLAARQEGSVVEDDKVRRAVLRSLAELSRQEALEGEPALALLETAGGPLSPGPSGTAQARLYRPLRLPGILVGSGKLGGISTTACALETLHLRGYDIQAVLLLEEPRWENGKALRELLPHDLPIYCLPPCLRPPNGLAGAAGTRSLDEELIRWLAATCSAFREVRDYLIDAHTRRVQRLQGLAGECERSVWWPFTQHAHVSPDRIGTVDARSGEFYDMFLAVGSSSTLPIQAHGPGLRLLYDGCASWWTQGVNEELRERLTRTLGYAAGRYGHVIHPEMAHQPAADVAGLLLRGPGAGWASRVFFSDDGSTAIEVALKMAFRRFTEDRPGLGPDVDLRVVGLQGAYHGDTLGAMDAVEPSLFNARQSPWYKGRGLFLDPPITGIVKGKWTVEIPVSWRADAASGSPNPLANEDVLESHTYSTYAELLHPARDSTPLAALYHQHIASALSQYERDGKVVGACIMEPLLLGAGGMLAPDPLFQRTLVGTMRDCGIPVIADEVFSGLWRLGRAAAFAALRTTPDIACFAKLLTGGTIPLSATLATERVFEAFKGQEKRDALLHGHSYSAHPIGCAVAAEALQIFSDPASNPVLCSPEKGARCQRKPQCEQACGQLLPQWDSALLNDVSHHPRVLRVVHLGTVVAVHLRPREGAGGYASGEAAAVTWALRGAGIYARPLGNVVYLMVTPTTLPETAAPLLQALVKALEST